MLIKKSKRATFLFRSILGIIVPLMNKYFLHTLYTAELTVLQSDLPEEHKVL